jgi:uncharacterized DUF497 family protein
MNRFEWSKQKADANLRKHGVSFEEAATVFDDPLVQELRDDVIRIISARKAEAHERQRYEEG